MANVPKLQTTADVTQSQAADGVSQLVPTGSVLTFAGSSAPTGWLVCDGASLSTTTYASLFDVIGYTFGGSGSSFNLPDLRGRFVRYDNNMGNHGIPGVTATNAASRDTGRAHGSAQAQATAKNGLSNSPSAVTGTISGDGAHYNHAFGYRTQSGLAIGGQDSRYMMLGTDAPGGYAKPVQGNPGAEIAGSHSHTFTGGSAAAQVIAGDAETRPINIALNAIIKI